MNPNDRNREVFYSISGVSYITPPEAADVEAAAHISGTLLSVDSSDCYVKNEDGERAVYVMFDKDALAASVILGAEYGVRFNNIVRITEQSAGGYYSHDAVFDGGAGDGLPDGFAALVARYQAAHPGKFPYIVRHVLKAEIEGDITLAVQPEDSFGNYKQYEAAEKVTVTLLYPPAAPTGLTATGSTSYSIRLSWDTVSNAGGYRVYRSTAADGAYAPVGEDLSPGTTTYTDTGLALDTAYWYKVQAFNAVGESEWPAAVSERTPSKAGHYYVRSGGAGNRSGLFWANASGDLQAMIEAAYTNKAVNGGVAVVHVGAGTYTPASPPPGSISLDSKDNSFFLRPGVEVKGGYTAAGEDIEETDRQIRFDAGGKAIYAVHQATLSGGNNAYHVVMSMDIPDNGATVLDGFIITGGSANGGGTLSVGGQNIPRNSGGGMYNSANGGTCSPVLTNLTITGNKAGSDGNGMYNYKSSGIFGLKIRNSIIWGNGGTSGIYDNGALPTVTDSIVQGGWTGAGANNSAGDPLFVDLQQATSTTPTTAGNYRLLSGSPAINAGSNIYYHSGQTPDLQHITTDLDGTARIKNTTIDMGAYEKE